MNCEYTNSVIRLISDLGFAKYNDILYEQDNIIVCVLDSGLSIDKNIIYYRKYQDFERLKLEIIYQLSVMMYSKNSK